ncbi:MAG TPA: efflux RND transporter permease subunit, partial [Polyangiaceae bacterium LLY-WYZ-15_(1-7)]|nr:efflux RND transporter permease subunit [Polyangiaceae bacterium LLY-WYZ-15_(1-7)]
MNEPTPGRPEGPGPYREAESSTAETPERSGFLAYFAQNTVAANTIMLVLIAGGLAMLFTTVKQEVFPEVDIDTVLINVPYPGASPAEVEEGVALAIEEAVQGLDGVKEVRTTAVEGNAVVAVELLIGTDNDRALNDVKSAVDRITSFPEDAERPVISLATNRRQVISLVLHGNVEQAEHVLHDLAEQVRFDLLEKDGITYVEIDGTRPLEISVEVPQRRLREHGLTLGQVAQSIRQANVEIPGGGVKTRSGEVLLRTTERRDRGSEFRDVVLRSRADGSQLRLGDVAEIEDGFREEDRESFFNGQRAVMVNVFRVGEETPIEVSDTVKAYLEEELVHRLPPGIEATTWNDQSEVYADRIDLLARNAWIGLILVLVILGLFLEPRLAIWVTLGIPISFAGSLLFLPSADVSINMISLFAFIVTLGMVVDDAIVVGEAIYQKRSEGMGFMDAAIAGVKEVAVPVLFAIITTCVAFSPLLFVPGVSGKFFRNIPIVVISVLLISLIESLLVLPAHLSHKMPWQLRFLLSPLLVPLELLAKLRVDKGLAWFIRKAYRPSLGAALRWRYLTFAIACALGLGTCGLPAGGRLQFTFLPKIEGDVISVQLRMPVGTSVEETRIHQERIVEEAQALIDEHGGERILRGLYSQVGVAQGFGGGPRGSQGSTGSHLMSAMVYLVQSDQREVETRDFAEEWRRRIGEIPGAEALTFSYSIGASAGSPVDIQLSHPDNDVLEAAAERLAEEMGEYPGLRDIDSGVSPGKEQLDLTLTPEGRARVLTEAELARQIRDAFFGAEAVRQQRGREEIRVYVRRPLEERTSMEHIEQLVVRTPDGGEMPLGQAAEVARGRAYTTISRVDGRRVISVTADIVQGEGNANQIVAALTAPDGEVTALMDDVPGLSYELGGEQQEQGQSLKSLGIGFILALFVMYGLLAVAFKSYMQPMIVMFGAIPFGIVGAFGGHIVMGFGLSIISLMGVVALSGVVVNDSLILVDAINRYREEGMGAEEAVRAAGERRFRPILLTSLTTFFGLAPMILEPSVQARFLIPMAISLGFGVLFATAILLMLVPSAYLIVEDIKRGVGKLFARAPELFDEDDPEPTAEPIGG